MFGGATLIGMALAARSASSPDKSGAVGFWMTSQNPCAIEPPHDHRRHQLLVL
jgi:hypothetical protein